MSTLKGERERRRRGKKSALKICMAKQEGNSGRTDRVTEECGNVMLVNVGGQPNVLTWELLMISGKSCVWGYYESNASLLHWCYSAELQKSVPGQPSVSDVVQAVLKECRKENLKYKMVALRCMAAVLQATKEDRFQELADIIFPMIKKVVVHLLGFSLLQSNHVAVVWLMRLKACQISAEKAVQGGHHTQLNPF